MRKLMLCLVLVCALLVGVGAAYAELAGRIVSDNPGDWRLWQQRDGNLFTIRTKFLGNIDLFADPRTVWADEGVHVIRYGGDLSLDIFSGTRTESITYNSAGEVVFTLSRRPLLKVDGTLWASSSGATGYIPPLNDLRLPYVAFKLKDGTEVIEQFSSSFIIARIPADDSAAGEESSGGCAAVAPFAALLLLPVGALALRRRK